MRFMPLRAVALHLLPALFLLPTALCLLPTFLSAAEPALQIASFQADVTPPLGSPLCYGLVPPVRSVTDPLSAKGIVLLGEGSPIVLCALDWVGVDNTAHDAWREALARAAGTTPDRVVVHSLHQHDAPGCDFATEAVLAEHGLSGAEFHVAFLRQAITHTAQAVAEAVRKPATVTHVGHGRGKVEHVASNRRVLGPDGKVKYVRYSATKDEKIRAEPEGTIDPEVKLVSFWDGERPLAVLSYYATHPQSYYGQGDVTYDFVGMARELRAKDLPGVAVVHFNGAAGNVTAGRYNDGSPANRPALAQRLADGMKLAWDNTQRVPVKAGDVRWATTEVALPLRDRLEDEAPLVKDVDNAKLDLRLRIRSARDLAYAHRVKAGYKMPLSCLHVGPACVMHMPGELFIEYQLAAQKMRDDKLVCMAAYGDCGPGYIGTAISYTQGGYETGVVSRTSPDVEGVLLAAIRELLK
jgi:hypothetical protein